MAQEPYPGEIPPVAGLKFKIIIHQTFIDIDEQETEAAAATVVITEGYVNDRRDYSPPEFTFHADKPFLFLPRDRRTNVIVFMGRYVSAEQASAM